MISRLYFIILIYLSIKFQNLKKDIDYTSLSKILNLLFNIFLAMCSIKCAIGDFEKIDFPLLIITSKVFYIIKCVKEIASFKRNGKKLFFLLLLTTVMIFLCISGK